MTFTPTDSFQLKWYCKSHANLISYRTFKGFDGFVHLINGEIENMKRFPICIAKRYTLRENQVCSLKALYLDQLFPASLIVHYCLIKIYLMGWRCDVALWQNLYESLSLIPSSASPPTHRQHFKLNLP